MAPPDLDAWLADPAARTFHRRVARADQDALWRAMGTVRLSECRVLGRIVRWRIPGEPAQVTFRELFRTDPFTVLEEGERHSLSGLVGRIWTLRRDYPKLRDGEAFRAWSRGRHGQGPDRALGRARQRRALGRGQRGAGRGGRPAGAAGSCGWSGR